jgi:outer membrane protein OmpA-like peptidoglycan-associated protein
MRRLFVLALALCLTAPAFAQAQVVSQASAADRNFVVFFQEWSAAFDKPAAAVIADAAKTAAASQTAPIVVTGYADAIGSGRANELVSELRAQLVVDALVDAGVPAVRIQQKAVGGVGFSLSPQESRRVTVSIGEK